MPFETTVFAPRKIAIIGGGISGLGAAFNLADRHDVTVFEAEPRLGGHARTIVAGKNGDQPVDTGFIVFNRVNYPHMVKLFEELEVPVALSDMSFGASLRGGEMEYGLKNLRAVFAQGKNALNPKFLGMLRDVMRFNVHALNEAHDRSLSLGDFLDKMRLGAWFRDYYLLPLSGAIWSTPTEKILDFPAHALIQFFENHALLHHSGQHQWYTVQGGSESYVSRLEASLRAKGATLRTNAPVQSVRRVLGGVELRAHGSDWESYDDVIFATHSDDTLKLLSDPRHYEAEALGKVAYQPNRIVLHADETVMPKRRACWSSWNYTETAKKEMNAIDLTYWMNCLQPIPKDDQMFVTLNSTRPIREELIYDECTLRHPVYDIAALDAQRAVRAFNGAANTWYCGAWMKNGFHEDGLSSGIDVAEAIRQREVQAAAA
jgi:predicted NAD/FAD-binding protein